MNGSVYADGRSPRRFDGIRLPAPSPQEHAGFPVTVYDAAGYPCVMTADEWRAAHPRPVCPHGRVICPSCSHSPKRHREPQATDAELIEAIAG